VAGLGLELWLLASDPPSLTTSHCYMAPTCLHPMLLPATITAQGELSKCPLLPAANPGSHTLIPASSPSSPAPPFCPQSLCIVFCPCFVFLFPSTLFPWRLSKATFHHQGTQQGRGPAGTWDFPNPSLRWYWGGHYLTYLFVWSSPAPHPPSCCSGWGR
jgi:hypothetical protein